MRQSLRSTEALMCVDLRADPGLDDSELCPKAAGRVGCADGVDNFGPRCASRRVSLSWGLGRSRLRIRT